MQGLSHRERELVALKFFAGLTTAEIASVLSVGQRAAAMRVHRTIEKLRRACDEAE
jgi:DNA-directed RNA polymerase specialized sigma24 family protein